MLTSMGLKEIRGIGKDEQGPIDPIPVIKRPKRLGMGANIGTSLTKKTDLHPLLCHQEKVDKWYQEHVKQRFIRQIPPLQEKNPIGEPPKVAVTGDEGEGIIEAIEKATREATEQTRVVTKGVVGKIREEDKSKSIEGVEYMEKG